MSLDKNDRRYALLINALDETTNLLDFRQGPHSEPYYASARLAKEQLRAAVYSHGATELAPTLWATGHAHIDTAWLWRLAHTRKKCQRTFSTVLEMMRKYPDYKFSCSQPQQYDYIHEDDPDLFEGIKEAIAAGRWETVGGMWIEADCNVVSGESLVRQFLVGNGYTQRNFGTKSRVLWLPDVFGYSAALPQIIKKSGMDYFMTIKIFWSQFNKPPYQTFEWAGLDGTKVLTHFSPLGDYNAIMTPEQFKRNWDGYNQKALNDSALYIYGYGDGGGGPTYQMLEVAQRTKNFVGTPKIKLSTAEAFFEDLETQVEGKANLPLWSGELYLEYHRGTYTSQARNKKSNRESEFLYQTAEQVSAIALALTGAAYPQAQINKGWELILLNQFHDIIPGSSITEVYQDSARDYTQVEAIGVEALDSGLAALAANIETATGGTLIYNPLSWAREDVAVLPKELGSDGQDAEDLDGNPIVVTPLNGKIPATGYAVVSGVASDGENELSISLDALENRFFKITLDENREISSILDKRAGHEVIDAGSYCKGNALLTFEDKPLTYDAWDIDIFYYDKMYTVQNITSQRVIETGPIRGGIEIVRTVEGGRGSTIRQRIFVYRDLPRIDFETELDWRDQSTLLKVAFPVTINALKATYDIQFGNTERPTHWNTTWDWARFEVCGHKWADLSEGDYGVSLLSDSKYGWDIRGNVMRLTLLKSAISPDPTADQGKHQFTYSLYPHEGDWRDAETIRRSYELNVPIKARRLEPQSGTLPATFSLVSVDAPNLILETVKKAEDGDDLIVRLYDSNNQRGTATLTFARPIAFASAVNLMEDAPDGDAPQVDGERLTFSYKPFEIKTFRVKM